MWVDKNNKIWTGGRLEYNGRVIFNPSDATLRKAGFEWKEPEAPPAAEVDYSEFNAACETFRTVCAEIEELIGTKFKGGFDEIDTFEKNAKSQSTAGIKLAIKLMYADKLCSYTAKKSGLGQPEWWYKCWEAAEN